MFGLLKKAVIFGVIILLGYAIINPDGFTKFKNKAFKILPISNASVEEINSRAKSENIKDDPWSNADADVPEDFDSGYRPESGIKTTVKKITNSVGKDEYGYKK